MKPALTLRDRIIRLFQIPGLLVGDVGVRELMARLPDALLASVSKECRYMEEMGLLNAERVSNSGHGGRLLFRATPLLLAAGTLAVNEGTVLVLLKRPMTCKDLRYAMHTACGQRVQKRVIQGFVDTLVQLGRAIRAAGGSVKYPRYVRAHGHGEGIALASVAAAWARLPGAWTGGVRRSNEPERPPRPR